MFQNQHVGGIEMQNLLHPASRIGVADGQASFIGGFTGSKPFRIDGQPHNASVVAERLVSKIEAGADISVTGLELEDSLNSLHIISSKRLLVVELIAAPESHIGCRTMICLGLLELDLCRAIVLVVGEDLEDQGFRA